MSTEKWRASTITPVACRTSGEETCSVHVSLVCGIPCTRHGTKLVEHNAACGMIHCAWRQCCMAVAEVPGCS